MASPRTTADISKLQAELAAANQRAAQLEQELTKHQFNVEVGSASSHDVQLLRGQLEAARAELESSQLQWAQERAALQAASADMFAELQRTHSVLEHAVSKVGCS